MLHVHKYTAENQSSYALLV